MSRRRRKTHKDDAGLIRVRQVLWFVGIWCASLLALSIVAYGIRAVLL